jgi:hypothetical protein
VSIADEGSGAPIEMPATKCFKGARDCHPLLFSGLWLAASALAHAQGSHAKAKNCFPANVSAGGIAGEDETQVSGFHLVPGRPSQPSFLLSHLPSLLLHPMSDI